MGGGSGGVPIFLLFQIPVALVRQNSAKFRLRPRLMLYGIDQTRKIGIQQQIIFIVGFFDASLANVALLLVLQGA